ncbi:MAG: hypothetical protein L0154_27320 [Chloroflexi bacterium]|nr:hypothetical protein [Chloroflexota bacterium]
MTNRSVFYIDKLNHTLADELLVFGWARVVDELLASQAGDNRRLTIKDQGAYYELRCDPPLAEETIAAQSGNLVFLKPIQTVKNAETIPAEIGVIDYEAAKEQTSLFFEARRKAVKGQELEIAPHEYWDTLRLINPAALPGYNALALDWWNIRDQQADILSVLCDLFSTTPNDIDGAVDRWKALDKEYAWNISYDATGQQIYNPDQGKGQNRTKLGLSIGNVKNFWLLEYLKAVGFYDGALTKSVRGASDKKTFVVAPRELTFGEHQAIMNKFRETMSASESHKKFDVLASIRYTQALLDHFSEHPDPFGRLRNPKKHLVAGFNTVFYLDMGNAVATMNLSFIALPGWITIEDVSQIAVYQDILDELEKLVRQFDESHSDVHTLLQNMRDFISGDNLRAFFRFTNAYTGYLMGRSERGQYVYRYTTLFIERLMMSTEKRFSAILEGPGFQNVAYAIRQSTVTAQYRKKQGDRKYDVRYGLGQELARKARYESDFIAALGDFIFKYNAENAQIMETRPKPWRKSLTMSDVEEVVALIDEYGSQTVASLLIAYGYARVPRETDDEEFSEA